MTREYMVSVYMTTYYHEKYIRQAIESILSQKVNFDYEIVISDDASKDKTPEILKEYAEKYNFIKINLNAENIGLSENMFKAKSMCSGKYIVDLSGDDYWIDNNKLQKQLDFLEKNKEYLGIANRLEARTNNNNIADFIVPKIKNCNKAFTLADFLKGEEFPMNGMMMRNIIKDNYDFFAIMPEVSKYIDDITDSILILTKGDIYISDDITVAYRRRVGDKKENNFNSVNSGLPLFKKGIDLLNNLYDKTHGEYDLMNRYIVKITPSIVRCLRFHTAREYFEIINTIPIEYRKRWLVVKSFFNIPKETVKVLMRKL